MIAKVLKVMFVVALMVFVGNPAVFAKDAEVVLRLAEAQADTYPATMGAIEFARLVEERSDGRIKVEVYTGGQLGGDEKAVLEQVQFGAIELTRVNISPVTELAPILNLLQMPYLYKDYDHMHRVVDSKIGAKLLDSVDSSNLVGLAFYDEGARNFYNSVRPITSFADMKGLKLRVPQSQLMMGMVNALGASATPMPFGEVYGALQTHVIDGAENNWPSYQVTSHYEVAKNITEDRHTMAPAILVGSKVALGRLSSEDLALVKKAAADSVVYQRKVIMDKEDAAKKQLLASGVVLSKLTDREKFVEAVYPLYKEFAADYMDLLEKIKNM